MKDLFKRIFVISFFGIFAGYLIYSFFEKKSLVQAQYMNINTPLYLIFIILSLYLSIFYGWYPVHIKFSRATLFVIGLACIVAGKVLFINDPINDIYFGDISCILGVILLIIGPTNIIITSKVKKKRDEKNLEIIEV